MRTIFCSEQVFTGAEDRVLPLCIVVENARITAVFPLDELQQYRRPDDEIVDFGTAFVCPGFHDAHEHVLDAALFPSACAEEYAGSSEEDCIAHMVEFAKRRLGSSWLLSHGWRDNLWNPPVAPTRASLDKAFPHRPVALYSGDGHTVWTNSAGLTKLGLTDESEPPVGGSYDRDEAGHLTGVLREAAGMEAMATILGSFTAEELVPIYEAYFQRLNALGITAVCDMALSLIPGADGIRPDVYEALEAAGTLRVRAHLFPTLTDDQSNLEHLQERLEDDYIRAPGFKQFFDGVSSQHTAWCSEPYENPRFEGDCGRPTVAPERMRTLVLGAAARGHAVRIHAIGDKAVHCAAEIFAEAFDRYGVPTQGANTIEHLEDICSEDIDLMARAHVIASVQPPHIVIDTTQPDRDLGEKRAARMWPFDMLNKAGVTLAFGTDAPVVSPDSREVLYSAVVRKDPKTHLPQDGWQPEHNLGRAEALRAYSLGSAAAVGRMHDLGMLQPGYLADFAVWDTNLLTCPADAILDAHTMATYVGGTCVYRANCASGNERNHA